MLLLWHTTERRERKASLLPTVGVLSIPGELNVCLPENQWLKTFASFWKANVPGICKFQMVTFHSYFRKQSVQREISHRGQGRSIWTHCLYLSNTISETLFLWTYEFQEEYRSYHKQWFLRNWMNNYICNFSSVIISRLPKGCLFETRLKVTNWKSNERHTWFKLIIICF